MVVTLLTIDDSKAWKELYDKINTSTNLMKAVLSDTREVLAELKQIRDQKKYRRL